eukprot:g1324.t1
MCDESSREWKRLYDEHMSEAQQLSPKQLGAKIVSASLGAIMTSLFMNPLDVVKTRLQSQAPKDVVCAGTTPAECARCSYYIRFNGLMEHTMPKQNVPSLGSVRTLNSLTSAAAENAAKNIVAETAASQCLNIPPHYNSSTEAFFGISRSEGVQALYRGLTPTLLLAVPNTITYFVLYDELTKRFTALLRASRVRANNAPDLHNSDLLNTNDHQRTNNISTQNHRKTTTTVENLIPALSGISARMIAATVISPMELVRTRMQASMGSPTDTLEFAPSASGAKRVPSSCTARSRIAYHFSSLIREGGYRALWRGLTPTLWRDVPFSGIYWYSYETLKAKFNSDVDHSPNRIMINSFAAGALSGSIAAILTNPFDVMKTRTQVRALTLGDGTTNGNTKLSLRESYQLVLKESGYSGFYAGLAPRLAKVAPACAIMISSYEVGKKWLAEF